MPGTTSTAVTDLPGPCHAVSKPSTGATLLVRTVPCARAQSCFPGDIIAVRATPKIGKWNSFLHRFRIWELGLRFHPRIHEF